MLEVSAQALAKQRYIHIPTMKIRSIVVITQCFLISIFENDKDV